MAGDVADCHGAGAGGAMGAVWSRGRAAKRSHRQVWRLASDARFGPGGAVRLGRACRALAAWPPPAPLPPSRWRACGVDLRQLPRILRGACRTRIRHIRAPQEPGAMHWCRAGLPRQRRQSLDVAWGLIPCAIVEGPSRLGFARASPLLEEERDASGQARVPDGAHPVWVHRAGSRP